MNNTKRFNIIDADRNCYRFLSLGSLDRISCRDQISPLQNRVGNIGRSNPITMSGQSTFRTTEEFIIFPVIFPSMPTLVAPLGSVSWTYSCDFNSFSQSYAIQSVKELGIRDSADKPIYFSSFAVAEFSSSLEVFEILNVNVSVVI